MSERNDADVLIVGAGPVGLTLAIDLAQRGVSVALMEMRAAGEPPVGRSNVVSARSMEAFRRLGIARAVREAGLPADYPHDVAIRTSATGLELGRVKIPCRAERYTAKGGPDTWWPTPEPPHRVNQIFLEPVLLGAAAATPRVRILNGMRVASIEQREDQILATATESAGNATTTIAARYVVGCDGAHSRVPPRDRRRFARRCGGAAGPDFGHPGAQPFGNDAGTGLGDRLHQSTQSRPRFRGRRAPAMDRPQIRSARRDDVARPRTQRPRHPRCRPVVLLRDVEFGGLGRAADARRPVPRSACLSLRRCGAYLGPFRRLRDERRHRRRHEPCLDAGGRHQGLGRSRSARRVRNRAAADHRPSVAPRDETRDEMGNALRPRPQYDRGARPRGRRRSRAHRPRGCRDHGPGHVLRWAQLWLFLRGLADRRVRRRGRARLRDGGLHPVDRSWLPYAASVAQ